MGTKPDEFFSALGTLPSELVRSLELVRRLDERVKILMEESNGLLGKYKDERGNVMEKNYLRGLLAATQKEALSCSKEKICIVQQVTDTVKTCISLLDQELAVMSQDMQKSGADTPGEETGKYCVCQRPSEGLMVACDNPQCPYEWFHFQCVGLQEQPSGQWFCSYCS